MRWLLLLIPTILSAQFDYDRTQRFDTQRQELSKRPTATLWGDSFAGPNGGRVNFVLVIPAPPVKPPYAGVIFQHGGGQSMTNYVSEALILAEAGVVSIIPDAPPRGDGRVSDSPVKLSTERNSIVEIVVCERRVLDYLLQQPGVDPKRIAYVGHSYGAAAGGALAGIETRIATFILMGGIAKTLPAHCGESERVLAKREGCGESRGPERNDRADRRGGSGSVPAESQGADSGAMRAVRYGRQHGGLP